MRTFYMLTPPSELPPLPQTIKSYIPVHLYTLSQIIITVVIFIVTLTKAGPVFPVIIILLVPLRLLAMNRIWSRETLRYVDAWACRDGTPEDDAERRERAKKRAGEAVATAFAAEHDVELGSGAAARADGDDAESIVLRPVSRSSRKDMESS